MANTEKVTRRNISRNWVIFLMMAPTLIGISIFSYGPAFEAIRHSFYNWDGAFTEEFVGLHNFRQLLGNMALWGALLGGGLCVFISSVLSARKQASRVLRVAGITLFVLATVLMVLDARYAMSPQETESMRVTPEAFKPLWVLRKMGSRL